MLAGKRSPVRSFVRSGATRVLQIAYALAEQPGSQSLRIRKHAIMQWPPPRVQTHSSSSSAARDGRPLRCITTLYNIQISAHGRRLAGEDRMMG